MLVLTRKRGDSVAVLALETCDDPVKVTVLEITNSQVKLGFDGPREVPIHRWEVWLRIAGKERRTAHPVIMTKIASDKWDDDGGSPKLVKGQPAPAPAI
jgi:carbon storage regulator